MIDEVTGISIHDGDTQLDFEKTDGTWYTTEDIDFPVDQDKMSALVSEYSDVESSRSLVNGDDLSAYGLDAPSLIISVTDGNGVVTQLLVGDKVGDEYYLKTADGDTIYTVADTVVSTVSGLTLYDYVKINQLPTVTADQIENITVDAGDKTYVMDAEDSVTSDSTSSGDEINASDTSSTAGTDETAESENTKSEKSNSEIWSSLTQALAGMSIDSCVDYNASEEALKTYGLKSPSKRIEYTYENDEGQNTVTLYIGEMTADGTGYYVLQSGSSAVNIILAQSIDGLLGCLQ